MTEDDRKALIASRLSIARQQAGLTQAQVATMMGMHRPTVTEIEAGRRAVTAYELVRFAEAYNVELDWLAGRDAEGINHARDELTLAARNASELNPDDLEKVIGILTSLRKTSQGHETTQ